MTRQGNDMETTEHLDKPATSGSAASTIKAEEYDLLILGSGAAGKLLSWNRLLSRPDLLAFGALSFGHRALAALEIPALAAALSRAFFFGAGF